MSPLDPISGKELPDIGPQGICDGLRNPTYMLYIYVAGRSNKKMDNEEMNLAELLKQTAEENQTRKILAILEESESLEDAKEKVKALLNK